MTPVIKRGTSDIWIGLQQTYGHFNNMQAFEEGWGIFDDGLIHCNITDSSLEGHTTADVRHFVERRANEGSAYHRRAWEIHCTTIATQRLNP
jgi:hypothetical protein